MNLKLFLPPALIILSFFIMGIVSRRYVLLKLSEYARRTKWGIDDIIVNALKSTIIFIFLIIGFYISLRITPLPPSLSSILDKIILSTIIFTFTIMAIKVTVGIIKYYGETLESISISTATLFTNLTKIIFLILGGLIILQTLGISITPIITALGVGGLAVALALQDTLSNFFAGLHIVLSRQVRVGDFVKLDSGEEGYITDIGWRNTTILMLPNNLVVVPNSKLASSIVTNYSYPQEELSVYITIGVSYSSDLEKVERVTREVAREVMKEVPGGVANFDPIVRFKEFGDSSINLFVILRAKDYLSQFVLKHEFIKRIHKRYNEEGIEIPFPIRTVYLKREDQGG